LEQGWTSTKRLPCRGVESTSPFRLLLGESALVMCGNLTWAGFIWVALSIILAVATSGSYYLPQWLRGPALVNGSNNRDDFSRHDSIDWDKYGDVTFTFSTFRRCKYWNIKVETAETSDSELKYKTNVYTVVDECGRYQDFSGTLGIPSLSWRLGTLLGGTASGLLILVALVALLAVCVRGVLNKCVSRLCGCFQLIAGWSIIIIESRQRACIVFVVFA
jgi:hypothetical protein